jgi:hypothetical protein
LHSPNLLDYEILVDHAKYQSKTHASLGMAAQTYQLRAFQICFSATTDTGPHP